MEKEKSPSPPPREKAPRASPRKGAGKMPGGQDRGKFNGPKTAEETRPCRDGAECKRDHCRFVHPAVPPTLLPPEEKVQDELYTRDHVDATYAQVAGNWTVKVPRISDKEMEWFAVRGIRVAINAPYYQNNPHYRSAALREHAMVAVLAWAQEHHKCNVWDMYGSHRTVAMAEKLLNATIAALVPDSQKKPADTWAKASALATQAARKWAFLDVETTGDEIVPADMLRRKVTPPHARPVFVDGRNADIILLVNVYADKEQSLTPAWFNRLITEHSTDGQEPWVIWVGHAMTEAWGTIAGEGAYHRGYDENKQVVVRFRADPESPPYTAHSPLDWLMTDGCLDGVAWTTIRAVGGASGLVIKFLRKSAMDAGFQEQPYAVRSWMPSKLPDPTGWRLKSWWTWALLKTLPVSLRPMISDIYGTQTREAILDCQMIKIIKRRFAARKVTSFTISQASEALAPLRETPEAKLMERLWPGYLDSQEFDSTLAVLAGVVVKETQQLEDFNAVYGDVLARKNAAIDAVGAVPAAGSSFLLYAVTACAGALALFIGWKARGLASRIFPSLNFTGFAFASGFHAAIDQAADWSSPVGQTLAVAVAEEGLRYALLQNKWVRHHIGWLSLGFAGADLAVDLFLGRPWGVSKQAARFVGHYWLSCLQLNGHDVREFCPRWDEFRRIEQEGPLPGFPEHEMATLFEPLPVDGETNVMATRQHPAERDYGRLNLYEEGGLVTREKGADGLIISTTQGLNFEPTNAAAMIESLPDEPAKNRVHWFQHLGVHFLQPGKTDKNLLATMLGRVLKMPPLGPVHNKDQAAAWGYGEHSTISGKVMQETWNEAMSKVPIQPIIDPSEAALRFWISTYPTRQRERLLQTADQLKGQYLALDQVPAVKVMVKTDELLLKLDPVDGNALNRDPQNWRSSFLPRPIYNINPKVQYSTGYWVNEAVDRMKRHWNLCPWDREPDFVFRNGSNDLPGWLIFGAATVGELSTLVTQARNHRDHVYIIVSGDDSLVHVRFAQDFSLEIDLKMCDQSIMMGPLELEYKTLNHFGVPEDRTAILRCSTRGKLVFAGKTFNVVLRRERCGTRETGASDTSGGNSLDVGFAIAASLKHQDLAVFDEAVFTASMLTYGFAVKLKVSRPALPGESLVGMTFLKMIVVNATAAGQPVLVFTPLLGRMHKMGKSYKDPRSYFKGRPTYEKAAKAFLRQVAQCYDQYVLDPLMRARVDSWLRLPSADLRETAAILDWEFRIQSSTTYDFRPSGHELVAIRDIKIDEQAWQQTCLIRYGDAFLQWQLLRFWFSFGHQFLFMQHPLLWVIALVDYA